MLKAFQLFAVAHEFAHAAFCHSLKAYELPSETVDWKDPKTKRILKQRVVASWRNEYLADYFAQILLDIYSEQHKSDPASYLYRSAGYIFLQAMEILERSDYLIRHQKEPFALNFDDPLLTEVTNNMHFGREMFVMNDRVKIADKKIADNWLGVEHPPLFYRKNALYTTSKDNLKKYLQNHVPLDEAEANFANLGSNMYIVGETLYNTYKNQIKELGKTSVSSAYSHNVLKQNALLYAESVRKYDYATTADLTYSFVRNAFGGRVGYMAKMKQNTEIYEKAHPGMKKILQITVGNLAADQEAGELTFNVVPICTRIIRDKNEYLVTSYVIGISDDKGKHWSFIESASNLEGLDQYLPGIGDLEIPDLTEKLIASNKNN